MFVRFSSMQCFILSSELRILTVNIVVKLGHTEISKRKKKKKGWNLTKILFPTQQILRF